MAARLPPLDWFPLMPYKHNAPRRHKIAKARYRVANWREYDAALRERGSLTESGSETLGQNPAEFKWIACRLPCGIADAGPHGRRA